MLSVPKQDRPPIIYIPTGLILISSNNGYDSVGPVVGKEVIAQMEARLRNIMLGNMNIQTDNLAFAERNMQTWVRTSDVMVRPPDKVTRVNVKEGTTHEDFKKRQKLGEIMMSDYTRANLTVRLRAGVCDETSWRTSRVGLTIGDLHELGLLTRDNYKRFWFGKFLIHLDQTVSAGDYVRLRTTTRPLWIYPVFPHAEKVLAEIMAQRVIDPTSLVTNVTAKANRSSLDLLTAAAEMPKTIKAGLRGAKLVAKILRDCKKRKFSLTTAHEQRKRRVNERYRKQIARLDKELKSNTISPSRRKALQQHRNKIDVGYRETLIKSADEFANELASLWMNYRYNIMTNVYLLQDAYNALDQFGREFVTSKGSQRKSGSVRLNGAFIDVHEDLRFTIKRKFSAQAAESAGSVLSNDIFVTAWELVPLSYVYDWFVNVGDLLSSQSYYYRHESQQACLASKLNTNALIINPSHDKCVVPPTVSVKGTAYIRRVIDPSSYCGLVWQPSMGLERQLDATALGWRAVRSLLLNGKKQ